MSAFQKDLLKRYSRHLLTAVAVLVILSFSAGLYGLSFHGKQPVPVKFLEAESKNATRLEKLIVFYAYMRGGSSFFGNMLKHNEDVFYWYEAEWEVYSRLIASPVYVYPLHILLNSSFHYRKPTEFERKYLKDQLKLMFTCQVDNLSAEQLTSWTYDESGPGVKEYLSCMHGLGMRNAAVEKCQQTLRRKCGHFASDSFKNGCHKFMMAAHGEAPEADVPKDFPAVENYTKCISSAKMELATCLPLLENSCRKRKYKAMKLLRADLDFVEDLMTDWDVKVVYQIRDPRGILVSRKRGHRQFLRLAKEARFLCQKMDRDFRTFQMLQKKYPDKFLLTSYEELASHPVAMTEKIYKFLDIPLYNYVKEWMYNITHSKREGALFEEVRLNSTATSSAWRKTLPNNVKKAIDDVCRNVYYKLDYEL